MSEELLQISPKTLGRYLYYRIGSTTLGQLKKQKVIKDKFSKSIATKKPDGLIVLSGGDVKAVIEYKQSSELRTKKLIDKAIQQELEVAKELCKVLIVTDGKKTFWINALNGERIIGEDGKELKFIFDAKPIENSSLSNEQIQNIEQLIDKIDHSLNSENNKISNPEVLDPSSLAKTIWQKIWINTGKEPEKCLYNVVELFVFKFLSDVGVLRSHNNFNSVFNLMTTESSNEALKHYANTCRREIRELFPAGSDGTTVINGTIFVNERGEPNLAQSSLFKEVLQDLQNYDSEFGSFKYIQKEFKTRLYESFLRQNAGIKALGQYFTPRNVVKAMVAMSDASQLKKGARVCDPFCGVGGFLLELISENKHIQKEFEPKNGKVEPEIKIIGYDKGSDEKEDERTIILAKANMLIYFSDLLVKYHSPDYLKAFSNGAFNKVFHLIRSNLGTFGKIEDEPYDLILTNPPYVTSGSSSLKRSLDNNGLSNYYNLGGRGTESLSIEWIIKNLKDDGQSLIVVPDGLMNQINVLEHIKTYCTVQGVVSLPIRTFYSTPKKTYILIVKKKLDIEEIQEEPIFTYLVSEIGETRDAKRWHTDDNDLTEMVSLFSQFKGSPKYFNSNSSRCKVIEFDKFNEKNNWMVDRWWNQSEKISLGVEEENSEIKQEEFICKLESVSSSISKTISQLYEEKQKGEIFPKILENTNTKSIELSDSKIFEMEIGNRVLKKDIQQTGITTYSANPNIPFGYIEKSNLTDFSKPSLLWGIDGVFDWNYIEQDIEFATTDHCGRLIIKNDSLLPKYIYYALKSTKEQYGFDRTYRASLNNMSDVVQVEVPINKDGKFDINTQMIIADQYEKIENVKKNIIEQLKLLDAVQIALD